VQLVPARVSPEVKRKGHETDRSFPLIGEVKNGGIVPRLPHASEWHNFKLLQLRDSFTPFHMVDDVVYSFT
jgi:hypothetical protein